MMKKLLFPTLLITLILSGCQSPYSSRSTNTHRAEDRRMEEENQRRMAGRIETLEMELGRVSRELDAQRQTLDSRLTGIERKNEADKRELVSNLTRQIEKLLKQAAPPPSAPASSGGSAYGFEHIVRKGETLSTIAKAYNVTAKAIASANKIKDANHLSIGQKLFIPE